MGSVANWYTPGRPNFRLAFARVVGEPNCDQTQNRTGDLQGQRYSSTRPIRTRPQSIAQSWRRTRDQIRFTQLRLLSWDQGVALVLSISATKLLNARSGSQRHRSSLDAST